MEKSRGNDNGQSESLGKYAFTPVDRAILARYGNVAETVARLFGSGCEVVIHSLEEFSPSANAPQSGEHFAPDVGELVAGELGGDDPYDLQASAGNAG
ncbi:MAG: hypothetical protein WCL50_19790 [Spirochaetota bacterium]